jgi:hypothetical protein
MKNNYLKLVMMAAVMLSASIGFAQTTTGDITKQAGIINGTTTTGGTVKVIDNKGTIKYLQVANGITSLTNITNDITTTTYQLGGTLTDNTYIDVSGNVFAIDGIALENGPASTDAVDFDVANVAGGGAGTGWTFLVRDEATGETRKLKFDNFITSEYKSDTYSSSTATPGSMTFTISALPLALSKTWVYRNGIKLISGIDYSVSPPNTLLITPPAPSATNLDWQFYDGDFITVQVLKF